MRQVARPLAAIALLVAAALLVGAGPGGAHGSGAHGNHLRADAQLTDDGTVVVETAFLLDDGYVAIHATNETGQPGEVLAHRRLDSGFYSPLDLQVDPAYWDRQSGPVRLWAVLHDDDGDGEFEPEGDDAPLYSFGQLAGSRFRVGRAEGKANIVAASFASRRSTGEVTLPRVSLPADGYVALRDDDTGERAGVVALDAGTHESVTVSLTEEYLRNASAERRVFLRATLYRDDGDGTFDRATDEPVRVGEQPISSTFAIRVPESVGDNLSNETDGNGTDGDGTATPTTTGGVNTPSPTTTALVNTPSPSTTAGTTAPTATATPTAAPTTTETDEGTSAGAPGFGPLVAAVAVVAAALLARRRR